MDEHKYEDKFLGDKQIKLTQPAGETRNGSKLTDVTFNDGSHQVWADVMLASEGVATPQLSDATTLRMHRMYPVVNRVLEVLLDYNVRYNEVNFLTQLIVASFNSNEEQADKFLWKTDDLGVRTMVDIDKVLSEIPTPKPTLKDVFEPKPKG